MNYWIDSLARKGALWQLKQARAIASDAASVDELPREGWTTVALPNTYAGTGTTPTSVWYRLEVNVSESTNELWAVYLPRPMANVAVFVNGHFVGDSGPMTRPLPFRTAPLLFTIPSALLRQGLNDVDVRSVRESSWGTLQAVQVGPDETLSTIFRWNLFFSVTIKQITIICMLAISLMMVTLFSLRSNDSAYGWFAVALLFWAAQIAVSLVPQLPFGDPAMRNALGGFASGMFVVCAVFFVHRFIGITYPKRERALALWTLLGATALLLNPYLLTLGIGWIFDVVWFPLSSFLVAYQTWLLARAARQKDVPGAALLAAVSWLLLVVGARDSLVWMAWMPSRPLLAPYTVGVVLLVFGLILLRRFVQVVHAAEHARDDLELHVVEQTQAIERNLMRLKDLEREQALSAERERIMRDVHDGVGGQLLEALSVAVNRSEWKSLEEPLRACLDELHMIIDSIEPTNSDLANVLATLRMQVTRRLAKSRVHMNWQIEDSPALSDFGPERALQVTRIVQEAIANALKHSHAKYITVRVQVLPEGASGGTPHAIAIEITDDGTGFALRENGGRGLTNMRGRAERLGAQLTIGTSSSGTTVRISFPLMKIKAVAATVATTLQEAET